VAAEAEQRSGELRRAVGGLLDLAQVVGAVGVGLAQAQERRQDPDRGEQVVEVVGDAGGEGAERFEALRVAQALLAVAAGGLGLALGIAIPIPSGI